MRSCYSIFQLEFLLSMSWMKIWNRLNQWRYVNYFCTWEFLKIYAEYVCNYGIMIFSCLFSFWATKRQLQRQWKLLLLKARQNKSNERDASLIMRSCGLWYFDVFEIVLVTRCIVNSYIKYMKVNKYSWTIYRVNELLLVLPWNAK